MTDLQHTHGAIQSCPKNLVKIFKQLILNLLSHNVMLFAWSVIDGHSAVLLWQRWIGGFHAVKGEEVYSKPPSCPTTLWCFVSSAHLSGFVGILYLSTPSITSRYWQCQMADRPSQEAPIETAYPRNTHSYTHSHGCSREFLFSLLEHKDIPLPAPPSITSLFFQAVTTCEAFPSWTQGPD